MWKFADCFSFLNKIEQGNELKMRVGKDMLEGVKKRYNIVTEKSGKVNRLGKYSIIKQAA